MKRLLLFTISVILYSCQSASTNKQQQTDTSGVVTLPADSVDRNMPIQPMDTAVSNMPVVNPDTSKVEPK